MPKIVIIALILKIGFAAVWTRLAANVSQACECSSLTFNWQYSSTYTTQSITWQWASLSTADVIANFAPAPELGFVAYGLFKNRLQFTPTASVTVTSLTLTDHPGVLVISILFYANLDFILPSSAVLSSVTPLDLCRSASTAVTLSENTTCLIYQGTPPVYSASATFSISCSWLRNGVIMLNSSVLVKVKVIGSGCGVGVYCYRCMVGMCTGQVDHVCRFITEYCQSASSIPNTSPSALAYSLPTGSEGAGGGPTCVVQWLVSCLSIVSTCYVAAMTVIIGLLSSQLQRLGQREYDVSGGLRHQAVLEHCH